MAWSSLSSFVLLYERRLLRRHSDPVSRPIVLIVLTAHCCSNRYDDPAISGGADGEYISASPYIASMLNLKISVCSIDRHQDMAN